jgi:hypothetical protein
MNQKFRLSLPWVYRSDQEQEQEQEQEQNDCVPCYPPDLTTVCVCVCVLWSGAANFLSQLFTQPRQAYFCDNIVLTVR